MCLLLAFAALLISTVIDFRVEDRSVRYVAEENIEIERPEEVRELMELAGRHFKRWDMESRTFISNIRDEYPDD